MGDLAVGALRGLLSLLDWTWEWRDRLRVVVLGVFVLVAATNWYFLRRVETYRQEPQRRWHSLKRDTPQLTYGAGAAADKDLPFVSVLVPARNEELNIERCVSSLLEQDYPEFEVLVLDDESTDGTAKILSHLAISARRLRLLSGRPLPAGWLGKHWACQQLAGAARGELLLFTDADTDHHPHMLRDAVIARRVEDADMLTGMPHEELMSWGEKLVLPVMHWALMSLLPLGPAHRLKSPHLSMGVGQFMLFTRSSYRALGGFEAIRGDPVDDMALARRTKSLGMRWRFLDLSARVRCRMYRGFRGAVDGLGKSAFPALKNKVWLLALALVLLGWLYLGPVGTGLGRLIGVSPGAGALFWAASAFGLALVGWILVMRRFDYPWYRALFFPLSIALVMGIGVRSAFQYWRGEARWKGRTLPGLAGGTGEEAPEKPQPPAG